MVKLLKEIGEMAEECSLTGALAGGASQAVTRYNAILGHLVANEKLPDGLFRPLPDDAAWAQLGVESRMLAAYLADDKGKSASRLGTDASVLVRLAPFVDSKDLAELVHEYAREGVTIDPGILTALAPFLDSSALGGLIRSHIGNLKNVVSGAVPKAPEGPSGEPEPVKTPSAPAAPGPVQAPSPPARDVVPFDVSPAKPTLEELAARLRRNDLSPEERQRIAVALADIAHEVGG